MPPLSARGLRERGEGGGEEVILFGEEDPSHLTCILLCEFAVGQVEAFQKLRGRIEASDVPHMQCQAIALCLEYTFAASEAEESSFFRLTVALLSTLFSCTI